MDDTNNTALPTAKIGRRNAKVGQVIRRTAAYLRASADRVHGQLASDRGEVVSIDIHTAYGITETYIMILWTVGNLTGKTTIAPKGIQVA